MLSPYTLPLGLAVLQANQIIPQLRHRYRRFVRQPKYLNKERGRGKATASEWIHPPLNPSIHSTNHRWILDKARRTLTHTHRYRDSATHACQAFQLHALKMHISSINRNSTRIVPPIPCQIINQYGRRETKQVHEANEKEEWPMQMTGKSAREAAVEAPSRQDIRLSSRAFKQLVVLFVLQIT